jgi:hypothetical protein
MSFKHAKVVTVKRRPKVFPDITTLCHLSEAWARADLWSRFFRLFRPVTDIRLEHGVLKILRLYN